MVLHLSIRDGVLVAVLRRRERGRVAEALCLRAVVRRIERRVVGELPLSQQRVVPEVLRLLLEKQVVRGSTGAITMLDGAISFFPNGSDRASACRPLTYEKKHR